MVSNKRVRLIYLLVFQALRSTGFPIKVALFKRSRPEPELQFFAQKKNPN